MARFRLARNLPVRVRDHASVGGPPHLYSEVSAPVAMKRGWNRVSISLNITAVDLKGREGFDWLEVHVQGSHDLAIWDFLSPPGGGPLSSDTVGTLTGETDVPGSPFIRLFYFINSVDFSASPPVLDEYFLIDVDVNTLEA